jgi:hypothetical protein
MFSGFAKSVKYSYKKQKGFDEVKRVFRGPFLKFRFFHIRRASITARVWFCKFLFLFFLTGCAPPDLKDPETYRAAIREAEPMGKLTHKRMYGMIMLYVDENDEPYTGWVKKEWESGQIKELGYLEDGQKQGTWMKWHANEVMESEIHWADDLMVGSFEGWHPNGSIKVQGQTRDGEVDGKWTQFYSNGKLERISDNRIGKLVSLKAWLPNSQPCPHSQVENGNGILNMYEENGTLKERRIFRDGVEIETGEKP